MKGASEIPQKTLSHLSNWLQKFHFRMERLLNNSQPSVSVCVVVRFRSSVVSLSEGDSWTLAGPAASPFQISEFAQKSRVPPSRLHLSTWLSLLGNGCYHMLQTHTCPGTKLCCRPHHSCIVKGTTTNLYYNTFISYHPKMSLLKCIFNCWAM